MVKWLEKRVEMEVRQGSHIFLIVEVEEGRSGEIPHGREIVL